MAERKFKIGETVRNSKSGQLYRIVSVRSERKGAFVYRIRLADGEREEIAKEADLSAASRRRP
jgi:hypothetical protein